MLENFIYSINVILPIFILVLFGWVLKRFNFLSNGFYEEADKLVFKVMLPCMLFLEVAQANIENTKGNGKIILFSVIGVTAAFILSCVLVPLFVKENYKRGAIIQGCFRSNFAILGIPLAQSMFGESGASVIAVMMPFVILMYNVYSVIAFSIFAPKDKVKSTGEVILDILRSAVTNPLIIAVILAVPFLVLKIEIPAFASKTLHYLSDATIALSLLSLGASITFESLKGKIGYSVSVTFIKIVLLPVVMISVAFLLGFKGPELGMIFVLFSTPSAVSSYIMAKNMHSDHELAGQILLLTTMFCTITIFLGIFIMKNLGWL